MSIEDAYREFLKERVDQLNAQKIAPFHYVLTPIRPMRETTGRLAPCMSARVIADLYGIPPWLIDARYDTWVEHWRWRLRYVRRSWRWLKRKARRLNAGGVGRR